MVSISDIKLNNESLSTPGSGPICAFVGATAGIGLATVQAVLKHTSSPTIYLVGRNSTRLNELINTSLAPLNKDATIIPILAEDLTLVKCAQAAAQEIASKTKRLDLLVMSAGYLSFSSAPDYSPSEGLDRITAIRFHTRMRFLVTLLPALRAAPNPRVVSILAGGQEGPLHLDDLGMTKHENYGFVYAASASASMNTLFMERAAREPGNEKIVFIHEYPGVVTDTGLSLSNSGWFLPLLWDWFVKPVLFRLIGRSLEEAGERVLFAATNGRFRRVEDPESVRGTLIQEGSNGVLGSGVYLLKDDSSVVTGGGSKDLKKLREQGAADKVWEYTMGEFERIEKL